MSPDPASITVAEDLDGLRSLLSREPGLRELGLGGVVIAPGAITRVPGICAELAGDGGHVAMICDRREMAGPGGEVKATLLGALAAHGLDARRVLVGDERSRTHADAETIAGAADRCRDAAVLVSVGSGTVADVGKAVSAQLDGRPHVVVQTAASVNGFADDQSVLLRDGVKRTTATRWPDRLVIDTEVVARAPAELNRAGLGDLLAGYTAPADWLLARLVGQDDSYCEAVVQLARAHVDPVLDVAAGIGGGEPAAIGPLSAGLTLSGISMGVAGATAPGSGMEHTASHLLEMAHDPSAPEAWHGAKVGALSVLASLLWARMRAAAADGALQDLRFPSAEEMHERVLGAFARLDGGGAMAEECWRDYSRKLERWLGSRHRLRSLPERWPAFDARLDELLAPATRLADALRTAGAPLRLGELGIDDGTGRWALANCHLMRDRFTVADLAFLTGRWEESDVRELLDEAATIGAGLVIEPRAYAGYVFDLDGTVYIDDELLPGADTTIQSLRDRGATVVFATNKPLETADQYAAKLSGLGIPTTPDQIVTAVDSVVRYLRAEHGGARLMTIAEEVVDRRLRREGFEITADPAATEVVVVSFDRSFDYAKLNAAYHAVRHGGAAIVATNPDPYCPTADGGLPDCAAMLAALEACTGRRAEAVLGKPSRWMAETCLQRLGVAASEAAVVGDRILTDVAMGKRLGAAGILVLSGATSAADVATSGVVPDLVLDGIAHLLPAADNR